MPTKSTALLAATLLAFGAHGAAFAKAATPAVKTPVGQVKLPVLSYTINKTGPAEGAHPKRTDMIEVTYSLKLLDGTEIDSSSLHGEQSSGLPLNRLIPAWQILVQMMRPGDDWTFFVPPEYGYGPTARDKLPANSFLIFRVELISSEAPE